MQSSTHNWLQKSPTYIDILTISILVSCSYICFVISRKFINFFKYILYDDCYKDLSEVINNNNNNCFVKKNFPNGWIPVIESSKIIKDTIEYVEFCDKKLVIFRQSNNQISAIDAFCPHNGANFSAGKLIKINNYDCIKCVFHEWSFRAEDGLCIDVPYAKDRKPPKNVKVKVWPCLEINGNIYIWHHSKAIQPTWFPPKIDEIKQNKWTYRARSEHIVSCLIQELPENGADSAHFTAIHAPGLLHGNSLKFPKPSIKNLIWHEWINDWHKCDPPEAHKAISKLRTKVYFARFQVIDLSVIGEQIGPTIVHLRFKVNFLGFTFNGMYIQAITPLKVMKQKIVHQIFMEKKLFSHFIARFMLLGHCAMFERDIEVWTNKIYLKHPKLVKEEKQITQFRRWLSQFFDSNENENKETIDTLDCDDW